MLPEKFLERMKNQLGAEYPSFLESLERPRAVALRFNPLKGTKPQLPFVQAEVPWEPMGFYYDPQARPGLHPYHEAGVYYLQEASAMSAVALLQPQPGEWYTPDARQFTTVHKDNTTEKIMLNILFAFIICHSFIIFTAYKPCSFL